MLPAAVRPPYTSANDAIAALAKASPRGTFPRAFIGEQPYWTLAGSDGGKVAALISEDAAIQNRKQSNIPKAVLKEFLLEPAAKTNRYARLLRHLHRMADFLSFYLAAGWRLLRVKSPEPPMPFIMLVPPTCVELTLP